ncbi:CARDB domain-containing protein [Psychroserpens sp. S379A]|uniref:CARDB domain-containing protein n=1 Tax=Psychroserpens sp. S379A TaxID=3415137 RepID=UPI003C7AFC6E
MNKFYIACFLCVQFATAQLSLPQFINFDNPSSDEGWTHYALDGSDNWERGHSNSNPFDTDLSWNTTLNGSPDSYSEMALESPAFDLTNAALPYVLTFKYEASINQGQLYLEYTLDNGATWSLLNPDGASKRNWQTAGGFSLSFGGFRYPALDISSLAGNNNVKFRFRFKTSFYVNGFGCSLDDFAIKPEYYNIYATTGEDIEISPLCPEIEVNTSLNFDNQYSQYYALETNYYLSTDTQLDASDTFLGTQSGNWSSSDTTFEYVVPTPPSLTPGQYYIVYKHDYTDALEEDDETDNVGYASLLVKPIFTLPYTTDFEDDDINWKSNRGSFTDFDIWERGVGTRHHIEETHSGDYAWHTSNTIIEHPDGTFQSVESPYFNLASETDPIILSFWYKANYPNGVGYYDNEYTVQYSIDCNPYWQELVIIPENMSDDWEYLNIPLDPSISDNENVRFRITYHNEYIEPEGLIFDDFYLGVEKPDLSIESIFSNDRYTSSNNATDVLKYQLRNSGTNLSQSIVTNFYWSNDNVLDASDVLLGSNTISTLAGNNTGEWLEFNYTKPTVATGNYFIIYDIDPSNALDEMRETNNIGVIPIEQTETFNFPYFNDFENDITGWKHNATLGQDDWELTNAQGQILNTVFSGDNAFITKPSGIASPWSRMHLYTPVFDLSSSVNPVLEFDMILDNFALCHCFEFTINVSYTTDNGATWLPLNPVNESFSKWKDVLEYNEYDATDVLNGTPYTEALFNKTELALAGYSAYNSRDIDRNTKYILSIPQLQNETSVRFRFNVGTMNNDGTSGNGDTEGALIDNFQIREAEIDLLVPYDKNLYLSAATQKLNFSIDVKNVGNYISSPSNIKFYLSQDENYDAGDYLIGTQPLNQIKPDRNHHLILEYNLPSTLSDYSYLVYVIDDTDSNDEIDETNNSGAWSLGLGGITQFPYLENFEADVLHGWSGFAYTNFTSTALTNYRVVNKLALTERVSMSERLYDGVLRTEEVPYGSWQTWYTPLYYIQTPTFDFTNTDTSEPLVMAFDLMSIGKYNENGANMEYSLDGGATWTILTVNSSPTTSNWYPYWTSMSDMAGQPGWFDYNGVILDVKMDISFLQNESSVTFRYKYFSNYATASSAPRGFRLDNFAIGGETIINDIDCVQDVPYTMDFDDYEAPCWFLNGVQMRSTQAEIQWELANNFSSDFSMYSAKINIDNQGDADGAWLMSPNFDVDELSQLKFNIALTQTGTNNATSLGSDDQVVLMSSYDNGENWTPLRTWNSASSISNENQLIEESITQTGFVRFAFWATNGTINDANSSTFYVSNFTVNESVLGIDEFQTDDFSYFPNPVTNQLTISANNINLERIDVFNVSGQLLLSTKPNTKEYEISFENHASGIYFVKVTSNENSKVFKILKE